MPQIIPAIVAAVVSAATAVSAVAANAALFLGAGSALTAAISTGAFALAEAGIVLGAGELLSSALKPHSKVGGGGQQVLFKADPQAGVPYAIGRTGTGGNIIFADVAGASNKYLSYVTVLSGGGPINAVESFSANNVAVNFSADGGEGATGTYANRMWMKTALGVASAAALTFTSTATVHTPANNAGIPTTWTSAQKLSGFAAALWTMEFDPNVYAAGTPQPVWVIKGVPAYDPRLDSTYPGGSGTQRAATRSTWTYTQNPYLHALAWCIGVNENGVRILGVGAPLAGIDVPAFVQGANVADANGWKVGGVVYSTDNKWDVLTAILQAGSGLPLKLGAKISCIVNQPLVSLATLTGADVVGDVTITATQPRRSRINAIWPRYREEAQGWQIVPTATPITVSAYASEDGGQRTREVEYVLCQDSNQAAVLARYDIENAREFGPNVFPCKPRWLGYKPGDCITVDEPEYGLNSQKMLILDRQLDPATMTVTLTCRTETDGKHAFALGQTADPPPTPSLTGFDPNISNTPAGGSWSMAGTIFTGPSGGGQPGIIIGGAVDSANATEIVIDFRERLTPTPTWGPWITKSYPRSTTTIYLTGLKPKAVYGAQVRYKTVRGVETFANALSLGTATAGSLVIDDQGLLATLDAIEGAQLAAGVGKNCLVDTTYTQNYNYWRASAQTGTSNGTVQTTSHGLKYLQNAATGVTVGNIASLSSDNQVNSLPIQPGEYLEGSAYVSGANLSAINIKLIWCNPDGSSFGQTVLQTTSTINSGTGELDTRVRIGGFAQAPSSGGTGGAGAYRVRLSVDGVASTSSPTIRAAYMLLAKANSGSDTITPWNMGIDIQAISFGTSAITETLGGATATLANFKTSSGISAGIAGQSDWATFTAAGPSLNLNGGAAAYRTVLAPLASTSSSVITVAAHTLNFPLNPSLSIGSASLTGLSADTPYNSFHNINTSGKHAEAGDTTAYITDADGWIMLGAQRTRQVDNVTFTAAIASPDGGGGAMIGWNPYAGLYKPY